MTESCPTCGKPSASPPAEVYCVDCATEGWEQDAAAHKAVMAGDGGRVPDVSEQRTEAIGAYLAQYPPSGFTDRYSAVGWSHIARGVLSAAAVFAAETRDPASVLAALLAENPEATVAAIEALLTSERAVEAASETAVEAVEYYGGWQSGFTALKSTGAALSAACRSLLSKAPKEDG